MIQEHVSMTNLARKGKSMSAVCKRKVALDRGYLNLRAGPSALDWDIGNVPNGAIVEVLVDGEWPFIRYGEKSGYVCGDYLEDYAEEAISSENDISHDAASDSQALTTIVRSDGAVIQLAGVWHVAQD